MTLQQTDFPEVTLALLNQRLEALERERSAPAVSPRWWQDHAGRFEHDPAFDEIVSLGRKARGAVKRRRRTERAGS